MAKLVLIDAYSIVFRAFYSVPPLTRADGVPVGAVYGFMTILINVINRLVPDYLVVAFDAGGETFRHEEYREYKANRLEAPAELKPQFSIVREAVTAMGLCQIEKRGYEADDIIATLVKTYQQEPDLEIVIVSGDKDLMQLVTDTVRMYDAHKEQLLGVNEVIQKFAVAQPSQILDVLALMGDSSDNVPGVPGIGPKSAAELVTKFGSVEGIYAHLAELPKNKRYEKLLEFKDQAFLSKTLVTLVDHLELEQQLPEFRYHPADPQTLLEFLYRQNFKSLIHRVEKEFRTTLDPRILAKISTEQAGGADLGLFATMSQPMLDTAATQEATVSMNQPLVNVDSAVSLRQLTPPVLQVINTVSDLEKLQEQIVYQGTCFLETKFQLERSINGVASLQSMTITLPDRRSFWIPIRDTVNASGNLDFFTILDGQTTEINELACLGILGALFQDPSVLKIGYDLKNLIKYLLSKQLKLVAYHDLLTMFYLLEAGRKSFHYFSDFYRYLQPSLQHDPLQAEMLLAIMVEEEKGHDLQEVLQQQQWSMENYIALRAEILLDSSQILQNRMLQEKLMANYCTIERPLLPVLAKMEKHGIAIDPIKLQDLSQEFSGKIHELERLIYQEAGEEFNIASPKQLGHILFEKMNVPQLHKAKKDKNPSTSSEILEELSALGYPIGEYIIQWRKFSKLKTTYTDPLGEQLDPVTGRIHTTFDATATNSGRLASNSPNLQNIPIRGEDGARIREAFIAAPGCKLIDIDYSQIELRVMAHMAGVKELQTSFRQHEDIHARTASQIFHVPIAEVTPVLRRQAKAINFGIIYGISPFGLAKQIGISNNDANQYIQEYFKHYPEIHSFAEECIQQAREQGFVMTLYGHRCFLPEIHSVNGEMRRFAERVAVNAPIQGTAADIIKKAMIQLDQVLSKDYPEAKILLQIHDELVLECPASMAEAVSTVSCQVMEKIVWLDVPLEVEAGIGDNWAQVH